MISLPGRPCRLNPGRLILEVHAGPRPRCVRATTVGALAACVSRLLARAVPSLVALRAMGAGGSVGTGASYVAILLTVIALLDAGRSVVDPRSQDRGVPDDA